MLRGQPAHWERRCDSDAPTEKIGWRLLDAEQNGQLGQSLVRHKLVRLLII
jgi:hypothetical protein